MKSRIVFSMAVIMCVSCGRFDNSSSDDHKGKERVISLAKQYTELMYALGAEEDLVAVDLSSTYPPEVKQLTTVGYHRALSAEAVLAAEPTLILHNNNIGPEHVTKQLEEVGAPMKVFGSNGRTWEGTMDLIREMGTYFHRDDRADSIVRAMDDAMNELRAEAQQYSDTPDVMIIHFGRATNTYLVMTGKSTGATMVELAGGRIPFDGDRGMRPLSPEVIAQYDPEVILMTNFGYDRLTDYDAILELPGVRGTKAANNRRIFRIEEHDLVYYGPRTPDNIRLIKKMLHEES